MSQYDLRKRNPSQAIHVTSINEEEEEDARREINTQDPTASGQNPDSKSKDQLIEIPVINIKHFKQVDQGEKLDLLMAAINKINTNFHYKFDSLNKQITNEKDGILSRLKNVEKGVEEMQARIDDFEHQLPTLKDLQDRVEMLELANARLMDDVSMIKGFQQVQDKQITQNAKKIVDVTARSMANNVIIYGLCPDTPEQDLEQLVYDFMTSKLQMELKPDEIEIAHRLGNKVGVKPRPMVVKCKSSLWKRVFGFMKNLKDLKNSLNDSFFVKPQLPEPLLTQKMEREDTLRRIKRANKLVSSEQQVPVEIKNKTLYVNKIPQKHHVFPPTVQEMYDIDVEMQNKIDSLEYVLSDKEEEKSSIFRAMALRVRNTQEVRLAYKKAKQLFPESDHIVLGYVLKTYTGYHNNGEHGAGKKVLQLLLDRCQNNSGVRDQEIRWNSPWPEEVHVH